jgi:hypothetical protein
MNFWFFIKFLKKYFFYRISNTKRYSELIKKVIDSKAQNILEVGVYTGRRSAELIECAKVFNKKIIYYGFDLFEDISDVKIKKELSKQPETMQKIKDKLLKLNCSILLFKGNTLKTLKLFKTNKRFDFIFIDGGHSIKTIANDWKYTEKKLSKKGIIVFDDYYIGDKNIIKKFGCNNLISELKKNSAYNVEFSKNTDYFPGKKYGIKLVFVRKL